MKIAICDDDKNQIYLTSNYIKKWADDKEVVVELYPFQSGEAFLFQWSTPKTFDMVFLDIHMGGISGIELAEKIRKIDEFIIIVFITGLKEYVFKGYDMRALHYLLKPVKESDCRKCLDQAREILSKQNDNVFLVPVEGQMRKFSYEDIYYFEVFSHYVEVNTKKGVFRYTK